jgi:hypothetical protein
MDEEKQESCVLPGSSLPIPLPSEAMGPPQSPREPPKEIILPKWRLIVLSTAFVPIQLPGKYLLTASLVSVSASSSRS